MNLGNTQAFPSPAFESFFGERNQPPETGMTLRQYYAGLAMAGFMTVGYSYGPRAVAKEAVEYADALLAELEKPNA